MAHLHACRERDGARPGQAVLRDGGAGQPVAQVEGCNVHQSHLRKQGFWVQAQHVTTEAAAAKVIAPGQCLHDVAPAAPNSPAV